MIFGSIRLNDYRCFFREMPATLQLETGLTSFIGMNNAGKSTLLKALYELRQVINEIGKNTNLLSGLPSVVTWTPPSPLHDNTEVIADRDYPFCEVDIEPFIPDADKEKFITCAKIKISSSKRISIEYYSHDGEIIPTENYIQGGTVLNVARKKGFNPSKLIDFASCLSTSLYFGPFRNAINEGSGQHFDSQIGTGFISDWHEWKTGPKKSQNRAVERVTEDIRRLIGAKTLEINGSNELGTLQVVIDKNPYKLQEIGAGFSQMIVTLGNALMRQPSFIFIDEPELHLHPALQTDFLYTLTAYARYGLLFTTHSMGLARLADNCYSVQKIEGRSSLRLFEKTHNFSEFLGSLGISGLMELGWNQILLVEGTKDVRTAQQLLRLYGKDRYTIILPLGGDSMVNGKISYELSEIRRLCNRVFALVDSERISSSHPPKKARREFADICGSLNIECLVTERRAIENYITQKAIDKAWDHGQFSALAPYDFPAEDNSFWGKGESWKAVKHMEKEEVDATDLGAFFSKM